MGAPSGGIGLNNGTLLTTSGITTSRTVNLIGNGTISVASGQTSTFNGAVEGNGGLTVAGSGTTVLTSTANGIGGGAAISSGATLSVATQNLATATLAINGGTLETTAAGTLVLPTTTISNGATIDVANSAETASVAILGGSGGLNVTGTGTLALVGTNSFTGGLNITGATALATADSALGATSGSVTLNGGTLSAATGPMLTTSRAIALGTNGGTINGNVQSTGTITGGGGLTATGGFYVDLASSTNSYSGGTTVTGSTTLVVAGDGSLGASTGSITLDNGLLDNPTGPLTTARTVKLESGGGTLLTGSAGATYSGKITGLGGLIIGSNGNPALVTLSGSNNDYDGGTTVNSASELLIGNGAAGSATGTGSLTLAINATLGGAGSIKSSSFSLQGGSKVIVGNGTDATSQMTLTGTSASTINGAELVFNLAVGATSQGQSNQLNLGSTPVNFTDTTLNLNVLGLGVIGADTSYTLVTTSSAINPTAYGLTVGSNGQITSGLSIAGGTLFGDSANGYTDGWYNGSYLYISGDDIDVEVVPEPSTWAMLLLGGFGVLAFARARRARIN